MTDNAGYRPTDDSALRWEDCHCTKCGQPDKKCECVALTPGTKPTLPSKYCYVVAYLEECHTVAMVSVSGSKHRAAGWYLQIADGVQATRFFGPFDTPQAAFAAVPNTTETVEQRDGPSTCRQEGHDWKVTCSDCGEVRPIPYVHLNSGGHDRDAKIYSVRDVEALLAVGEAMSRHAQKAETGALLCRYCPARFMTAWEHEIHEKEHAQKASERQPCSHGNATGHCQHCLDAL